jgi:hypothetical protein
MSDLGRWLVIIGVIIIVIGAIFMVAGKIPWLGKLPGDIAWRRGDFTLFIPFGTMLLVSVALTVILNIIGRFFR